MKLGIWTTKNIYKTGQLKSLAREFVLLKIEWTYRSDGAGMTSSHWTTVPVVVEKGMILLLADGILFVRE
jgi:hypothetical protein